MSAWIGDSALAHLRSIADWPDAGERYEVTHRVGRGGMGVVYAAFDRVLQREVAIKVLDDLASGADPDRIVAEARVLGQLEHPGIVPVHDVGKVSDGRVFYVMKLVRGERLDEALTSRSVAERLDFFLRICDAVSFAHARGIVHRDLKPQNVMLGSFGEVLVMDWGVAKVPGSGAENARSVGTPGYMAPEQERQPGDVDARADVYSLGVMLEVMLPVDGGKPLRAIARHARSPGADERYATVLDLARDVMRFRTGQPVSVYRESLTERLTRLYRRNELPILLVLAYVIMRMVLLAWRGV